MVDGSLAGYIFICIRLVKIESRAHKISRHITLTRVMVLRYICTSSLANNTIFYGVLLSDNFTYLNTP